MNFGQAIASVLQNYATFRGRATRSEYWWWALFATLLSMAARLADTELGIGLFSGLLSLALLLPGIAVGVRRLHDVDRSGWWYLLVFTVVGLIPLFIWSVQRGTSGANRFGADQLADESGMTLGIAGG